MSIFERYELECIGDIVLVKREENNEKTEGGLYVPETARGESLMATVLAVGPGRVDANGNRIKPQVSVGDKVIMDPISGVPLEIEGEKFRCVREPELVSIIRTK